MSRYPTHRTSPSPAVIQTLEPRRLLTITSDLIPYDPIHIYVSPGEDFVFRPADYVQDMLADIPEHRRGSSQVFGGSRRAEDMLPADLLPDERSHNKY